MKSNAPLFDVIVVGAGLMGSAAARHLAEMGLKVALIGPAEPVRKEVHNGVFASHYDQARVTRKLDRNADWSRLSEISINRYADIEEKGSQRFFHPVGSVMAGPEFGQGSDFIQNTQRIGKERSIPHVSLRADELRDRFPYLSFPDGILALYEEANAGWINPRDHVTAEINAAKASGAHLHRCEVIKITHKLHHVDLACADGSHYNASKVILACGAFSKADGLLLEPIPMKVYARTVTFFEIGDLEAERLRGMPSLVYVPPDLSCDPYILPPVRYPDGKLYLKIGGDPEDVELEAIQDIKAWFRTDGNKDVGQFLAGQVLKLMPDLDYHSVKYGSCATSFTATRKPLIYHQSDWLIALTGGNGAGAKCADELGHIAALVATGSTVPSDLYESSFRP